MSYTGDLRDKIHTQYKQLEDIAKYSCELHRGGCRSIRNYDKIRDCEEVYGQIYLLRLRMKRLLGGISDQGHEHWLRKISRLHDECEIKLKGRRFSVKKMKKKKKLKKKSKKKSKKKKSKSKKRSKLSKRSKRFKQNKKRIIKKIDSLHDLLDQLEEIQIESKK